jgi:putative transposase
VREVNRPQSDAEQAARVECIRRGRPFGQDKWVQTMAARYNLQSTLRPRGRQEGLAEAETKNRQRGGESN